MGFNSILCKSVQNSASMPNTALLCYDNESLCPDYSAFAIFKLTWLLGKAPNIVHSLRSSMAKRRNLKKEKAERNQAYARKFRKRPANGRMFKSRFRSPSSTSAEEDNEETSAAAT
jgi:hypothetical protein